MLIETLEKYVLTFDPCFVVIRSDDDEIERLLDAHFENQVQIIASDDAALGMGASLADGVRHIIKEHARLHALFVAHGDMPLVRQASLKKLRAMMEDLSLSNARSILRPEYKGTPGHPVGFAQAFLSELACLSGDAGAKTVLESHRDAVQTIQLSDAGVCVDFDTPA